MSGNFEVVPCGTQARLAQVEAERDALKTENERLNGMLSAANWNRAQEEHNALRAERDALLAACRMAMMLRQLGGMLPGSREIVDTVVEAAHAAIAKAQGGGND